MNTTDWQELLESYKTAHSRLLEVLKPLSKEIWGYQPNESEWSIHEIIWHLADTEANIYIRIRKAIAEPGCKVLAWDQDAWATKLEYTRQGFEAGMALFRYLRGINYELLKEQPEVTWNNTVDHSEYGVMTLEKIVQLADRHFNNHMDQIIKILEFWHARN